MTDNINTVRDDWILGLMQKGLIINLSIRRWRATAQLTYDDLGIKFLDDEAFQFSRRYLSLGDQLLLPPETLSEFCILDRRGRTLLKSMSFTTPWGKFVPETALDEWERANDAIRNDYMTAACMFGDRYDEMIGTVREDYKIFAKDVWARLYPENKNGMTPAFGEHFVQSVIEKIPSRENIVKSFSYSYICYEIPMPSLVQSDISRANEIRRKDELAADDLTVKKETKRRLASIYIDKKEEFLNDFLESTVEQLRGHVAKLCTSVLEALGKNKKKNKEITAVQKKKLKKMIENVKQLNFHNDKIISGLMGDLEKEVDKLKGERNNDIIFDRLNKIVEESTKDINPADFNPAVDYLEI